MEEPGDPPGAVEIGARDGHRGGEPRRDLAGEGRPRHHRGPRRGAEGVHHHLVEPSARVGVDSLGRPGHPRIIRRGDRHPREHLPERVARHREEDLAGTLHRRLQLRLDAETGGKCVTGEIAPVLAFPGKSHGSPRVAGPQGDSRAVAGEQEGERGPPRTGAEDRDHSHGALRHRAREETHEPVRTSLRSPAAGTDSPGTAGRAPARLKSSEKRVITRPTPRRSGGGRGSTNQRALLSNLMRRIPVSLSRAVPPRVEESNARRPRSPGEPGVSRPARAPRPAAAGGGSRRNRPAA